MQNQRASLQQRQIRTGDVDIQIEDHEGPGAPVLFLHFSGANLRMWDRIIPQMKSAHRCIAVDLRGHGKSSAPASGYNASDFAGDVLGVLDALAIGRAHLVGSSLGAEVGLRLAAAHPERVLSLTADGALCSEYGPYGTRPFPSLDEDSDMLERLQAMTEREEKTYVSADALVKATQAMYEGSPYWDEALAAVTAYGVAQREDGAFVNAWRKWANDEYMRDYFRLHVEEDWSRVCCPVLMLPDEDVQGDTTAFDIVKRLSALPQGPCEILVVPGSDHPFSWMRIPEAMADATLSFLRQVDSEVRT